MRNLVLHILFAFIVVGDFIGEAWGIKWLDYSFKPLLLPWIILYFFANSQNVPKSIKFLILPALLFSWAGDVFLMFPHINPLFFMAGLLSFLTAHVFYIILYLKTITLSGKRPFLIKKPLWILPYLIYGLLIYTILYAHLDDVMKIAVLVYLIAILIMAAMALNRFGNGHPVSFTLVMLGTLLFVVSDTLIAYNKFVSPIFMEGIFVMGTYISAQYLIMRGILKQYE